MRASDRRKITQTIGARVSFLDERLVTQLGTVVGHYDDDIVFVQLDGQEVPDRCWTEALHLEMNE